MSEIWWNLSGTDRRCDSYWAGHWMHWIQHKKSVQDPAPGIPVNASVDGDGVVVLEGPGVLLAEVSLVGRPFRVENGVVVALSTPFFYGPSRPFTSRALGTAPWALHCCR